MANSKAQKVIKTMEGKNTIKGAVDDALNDFGDLEDAMGFIEEELDDADMLETKAGKQFYKASELLDKGEVELKRLKKML